MGPSSPPSASVVQSESTSSCDSQSTWNETASLNENWGPPFRATTGLPPSSNSTVMTVPCDRGPAEP